MLPGILVLQRKQINPDALGVSETKRSRGVGRGVDRVGTKYGKGECRGWLEGLSSGRGHEACSCTSAIPEDKPKD